jgi:hypothetical protein
VTTVQWLLMFHITGAFFLVGGSVAAGVLIAERLAAAGDTRDNELRAILRDPRGNAMSWLAGLATLLLLVDMIWKPGA